MAAGILRFYRMSVAVDAKDKCTTTKDTKLHEGKPAGSSADKMSHRGDSIPHLSLMRIPKRGFT
jgi:hypothetical protein